MRLFSYVVARDYGFAPNPFYSICTLATCKPRIRQTASAGDWVIGTGSAVNGREGTLVYAMQVSEVVTFNTYWKDLRFSSKKPYLFGSKKQAFGDNIYFQENGVWRQANSHHSFADGTPNQANIARDTQADRVLISNDYGYWGGSGPNIPPTLRAGLCKRGPGHRSNFAPEFISDVLTWLRSLGEWGYCGDPLDWNKTS